MLIYFILIGTIIFSFITGIITTILERKEIEIQKKSQCKQRNSQVIKKQVTGIFSKKQTVSEVLSKTLEMSSITKKVDQIDLSEAKIQEEEYYSEPVIIAVLEDDTASAK